MTLATVADGGSILLEERHTNVARFERVTIDLSGTAGRGEMVRALARTLGQARDRVASEHLVALHLTGATPPDGVFVGSFGTGGAHDWTGEWLGAEMFFGHADDAAIIASARQLGMDLLRLDAVRQDNEEARFLCMLARKGE